MVKEMFGMAESDPNGEENWPKCEHRNLRWCWRNISGRQIYGTQCLNCGTWAAVKQYKIPHQDLASCGEYDVGCKEEYDRKVSEWYKAKSDERASQYQARAKNNRETELAEYYRSEKWRRFRKLRLRLNEVQFSGLCEICFESPADHLHHMTYERFRKEWIYDVAVLCEDCHKNQHPHMWGN